MYARIDDAGAVFVNGHKISLSRSPGHRGYSLLSADVARQALRVLSLPQRQGRHHGVKVGPAESRQLVAWIDSNGPYCGLQEARKQFPNAPVSVLTVAPTVIAGSVLAPMKEPWRQATVLRQVS